MLKKLADTKVELIKDARNWAYFSLISHAKRIENKLEIGLSAPMCDCLIEKNYTTLDLKVIRNFNSKYTILFYEMYQKYKDINFPILAISDFKKFCGIENKRTYNDFYKVKKDILKTALVELAEKEKIYLGYKLTKQSKAYSTIQFYITEEKDYTEHNDSPTMTQEEIDDAFERFKNENENYKKLFSK